MRERQDLQETPESDQPSEYIEPSLGDYRIVYSDIHPNPKYKPLGIANPQTMADFVPFINDIVRYALQNKETAHLFSLQGRGSTGTTALESELYELIAHEVAASSVILQMHTWDELMSVNISRNRFSFDQNKPADNDTLTRMSHDYANEIAEWAKTGGIGTANIPGATSATIRNQTGEPIVRVTERAFCVDMVHNINNLLPPFDSINPDNLIHAVSAFVVAGPLITMIMARYRQLLKNVGADLQEANRIQRIFNRRPFSNNTELSEAQEGAPMRNVNATQRAIERLTWRILDYLHAPMTISRNSLLMIQEDKRANETSFERYPQERRTKAIIEFATPDMLYSAQQLASFIIDEDDSNYENFLAQVLLAMAYKEAEIEIHKINGDFGEYPPGSALVKVVLENSFDLSRLEDQQIQIRKLFKAHRLNH